MSLPHPCKIHYQFAALFALPAVVQQQATGKLCNKGDLFVLHDTTFLPALSFRSVGTDSTIALIRHLGSY